MTYYPQSQPSVAVEVCNREVTRVQADTTKAKCSFTDGTSILISRILASFLRGGEKVRFPVGPEGTALVSQIYVEASAKPNARPDIFQTGIGYATQPRKDRCGRPFVFIQVTNPLLGVSRIHVRCEHIRDYFYVADRNRPWTQQPSLYELLRAKPNSSPAELQPAFQLALLELRNANAPASKLAAAERAFNLLSRPDLRACYDTCLADPTAPAVYPHGGFGSLLVLGNLSHDGNVFYANRIISFLPEQRRAHIHAPLRNVVFYREHAIYRDTRRKMEVCFDQSSLPLGWDLAWNRWKHLLAAKVSVQATFVQNGKYHRRGDEWELLKWETSVPSRMTVTLPDRIAEDVQQAQRNYDRMGRFSEALDQIRARLKGAAMERRELEKFCSDLGIPSDFDMRFITWQPGYELFYYKQLSMRARREYLFQSEYIFELEGAIVVETPQPGHATYLFSRPAEMTSFLATYPQISKVDIRRNRQNAATRLGFLCRLVHGSKPEAWLKELKARIGEDMERPVDWALTNGPSFETCIREGWNRRSRLAYVSAHRRNAAD
jgi:hypothetical protein